jgi:hypothetical protein
MLQTKAEFGLLIGRRIRLYYDGNLNKQQMPLMLERIPFDKNSEKGSMFVSIFNKDDFLNKRYTPQIQKLIESYTDAYNIKKLQEKLLSRQTKSEIINFLKDRYSDYGPDVIEGALNSIKIELSRMQDEEDATNGEILPHSEGLLQTVFSSIKLYKDGISTSELVKITGYQKKQIRNALYKLTKRDAVTALERGIYVAKTKSIPRKPAKSENGNSTSNPLIKGSLRERAYKLIKRRKSGFTVEEIRQEMSLDYKQVANILYYLSRRGFVNAKERGLYVAV